jgi:hypothetical protein
MCVCNCVSNDGTWNCFFQCPYDLEDSFVKKVQFLTIILLDGKQLHYLQAFCSVLGFS